MKQVLEICREVADLAGVERSSDLYNEYGSNWIKLMTTELKSLINYNWEVLVNEYKIKPYNSNSFTFKRIINGNFYCLCPCTIYISDDDGRIIGAIPYEEWKDNKKCTSGGTTLIITDKGIIFIKKPQGINLSFQYRSNDIVWDFDTFEEKNKITKNTDVPIFDEYLVKLGILWRWEKANNKDYSDSYAEYQKELKKRLALNIALTQF